MVAPFLAMAATPLIQKLVSNGMNILAGAVMNKGKEVIEEKLGVNLDTALESEEGVQQLRQLEIDHEEFLANAAIEHRKLDIREQEIAVDNTKSAREMNAAIQTSAEAMAFVKILPYLLDAAIVGGTLLIGVALFWWKIPVENKELAYTMFGGLLAHCGTILNFHRGSTSGSRKKDDTIDVLAKGAK